MIFRLYDPLTLKRKGFSEVVSHNILVDYINNPKSTFTIKGNNLDIRQYDIIEIEDDMYERKSPGNRKTLIKRKIIYTGIIDDYTANGVISTVHIYNLFNTTVDAKQFTSPDIKNLIMAINKEELLIPPLYIDTSLDEFALSYLKLPDNNSKFVTTSLLDLIIDAQKQTGSVLMFKIRQISTPTDAPKLVLSVGCFNNKDNPILLKNNTDFIKNLVLDKKAGGTKSYNKVNIVSADFHNIERTYYANKFGQIQDVFDSNVKTPVKLTIIEHNENNTYIAEAQSAIGGYQNEVSISFDVDLKGYDITQGLAIYDQPFDNFTIGKKFRFIINGDEYITTLTGFNYSNKTHLMTFLFGYQRNTLQSVLLNITNK